MRRFFLILILFLAGCAAQCQHDHTFRRFVREPNLPIRGNLLCRDCGAMIVSFVYEHPWNGPPDGFHGDDELLQKGGWEVPDTTESDKLLEESK